MNAGATFALQYGLRPGIALSAAQMAQLTSDIVWLVEQTVILADGSSQRVLVPQVYVRVKPGDIDGSGALLSGASVDVQLSGDLTNSAGTVAGRHTVRLNADNLNNLGGRITGHDVGITTRNDLNNIGGTIDAVSHLKLDVGRDLNVATTTRGATSSTGAAGDPRGVKLGAVAIDRVAGLYVTGEGGLLEADVGRDANFAGAQVRSAGDVRIHANGDINLGTVTTGREEDIRWNGKMSRHTLESTETGTTISAAGDARLRAEGDLSGRAATLEAGDTLRLSAGKRLTLVAGENQRSAETKHATKSGLEHYSLDASSQQVTLARTELSARHIELQSGENTVLGAVDAKADTLDIKASGKLVFQAQHGTDSASYQEAKGDAAWVSASGKGHVDETTEYSRFKVGKLTVDAKRGVEVQIGGKDTPASLARQPGMGWVDQLVNDPALAGKVDWQRVQEAHDKWQYRQTGLGPVSSALIMLVVAVATAGAGTAAAGTAGTAATGTTAATAGTGLAGTLGLPQGATTILAGALQGGITTLVGQATVSFMNNGGDLGKVFDELGSSASVKSLLTAMATGGALAGLNMDPNGFPTVNGGKQLFMDQLTQNVKAGAASALIKTALEGGSLEDNLAAGLKSAFLSTVAAQLANEIGGLELDAFVNKMAHAMAGCAVGAVSAGSSAGCASGALGAAVGELAAETLGRRDDTVQVAALMAGLAVALAGGDAGQVNLAATAGGNAAANNYLSHSPFAGVREVVAKENARLTALCEPNCTAEDFRRIDQQAAVVERAADLAEVAKRGVITPEQATRLAQTLLELVPVYGSGESVLQLITGQSSLTGEEASRIWAAVGLVPIAGGMVRKVGEPVVETLASALRALDGPIFKTTKEATQAAEALGYRRINETVNGQAVYTNGKSYISRDVDGHNGGAWKEADSVKNLGTKESRNGTFNADLSTRIGD
jgi:hypothetical protein